MFFSPPGMDWRTAQVNRKHYLGPTRGGAPKGPVRAQPLGLFRRLGENSANATKERRKRSKLRVLPTAQQGRKATPLEREATFRGPPDFALRKNRRRSVVRVVTTKGKTKRKAKNCARAGSLIEQFF